MVREHEDLRADANKCLKDALLLDVTTQLILKKEYGCIGILSSTRKTQLSWRKERTGSPVKLRHCATTSVINSCNFPRIPSQEQVKFLRLSKG